MLGRVRGLILVGWAISIAISGEYPPWTITVAHVVSSEINEEHAAATALGVTVVSSAAPRGWLMVPPHLPYRSLFPPVFTSDTYSAGFSVDFVRLLIEWIVFSMIAFVAWLAAYRHQK